MTLKTTSPLIRLVRCNIEKNGTILLPEISWKMNEGENWLVTGENGGGKSIFASALAGGLDIVPFDDGGYSNRFSGSISLVSFETAAALIAEEKARDDSDYVEGGIDPGRTARAFIAESFADADTPASGTASIPQGKNLERHPAVLTCGLAAILDRGLKYLSTGEIRRTLLCRALASNAALLILDEPFEGLDTASREILRDLLAEMTAPGREQKTRLLLLMDRPENLPPAINRVLELTNRRVSFSGPLLEYRRLLANRETKAAGERPGRLAEMWSELDEVRSRSGQNLAESIRTDKTVLVEMKNVTVEWSEKKVLDNLSWKLEKGEHWLIRGPNGSGKTTFLELITGDNPQVFRNEVYLFGSRRGSGETIWELKEKMGIVSYRLHVEYRALGDLDLESVILSGIHDSIGLYDRCGEEERALAKKWLGLAGFAGRETDRFGTLSYGEQRSVLIARAAVKCPPILILDEPCHGLDGEHRSRILALLEAIAAGGTSTLLHVTHDPTEALPCEKHVLELRPGETPMYRILPPDANAISP